MTAEMWLVVGLATLLVLVLLVQYVFWRARKNVYQMCSLKNGECPLLGTSEQIMSQPTVSMMNRDTPLMQSPPLPATPVISERNMERILHQITVSKDRMAPEGGQMTMGG